MALHRTRVRGGLGGGGGHRHHGGGGGWARGGGFSPTWYGGGWATYPDQIVIAPEVAPLPANIPGVTTPAATAAVVSPETSMLKKYGPGLAIAAAVYFLLLR